MNTAPLPAVQPTAAEMLARLAALAADAEGYLRVLRAAPGVPERHLIAYTAALEQLGGELARADYETSLAAAWQAREASLARDRAPRRHRAPRPRAGSRWLRAVDGQDPLPFAAALPVALAAARRAGAVLNAHLPHAATPLSQTAATAAATAVITLGAAHVTAAPARAARSWVPGTAAASLAPADAMPVVLPPASSYPYQPRHARLDASSSKPVKVIMAPAWTPSPSPSPSPSPGPSSAAPAGVLDVTQEHLVLTLAGTAELDFSAIGGALNWWAWGSDGVTLDLSAGTLAAGQPAAIKVSLAAGTTAGTVFVSGGGHVYAIPVAG